MNRTGYVYDERMANHRYHGDGTYVESPERITIPHEFLLSEGILDKCVKLDGRAATLDELSSIHPLEYIKKVRNYKTIEPFPGFKEDTPETYPTYVCDQTYDSACVAVGSVLNLVDAVCTGKCENGLALVRPPGHHAEYNETCGFSFFNNIALATKYARVTHHLAKVLILDWDVHHGNGLQHLFYEDDGVLYISLHRFDDGRYFPGLKDGNYDYIGEEKGRGYNVNIPWSGAKMGDAEYQSAFYDVIRTIVSSYNPELTLIACGLDAALGDLLGEYGITSPMYGWMTSQVKKWTNGKIIAVLEGGYNIRVMCDCLKEILNALIHDDKNDIGLEVGSAIPCKSAQETLQNVRKAHSQFWSF